MGQGHTKRNIQMWDHDGKSNGISDEKASQEPSRYLKDSSMIECLISAGYWESTKLRVQHSYRDTGSPYTHSLKKAMSASLFSSLC